MLIVPSRALNHEISYIAHNREYLIIEDNNMSILFRQVYIVSAVIDECSKVRWILEIEFR
jgi:hypothetical protein